MTNPLAIAAIIFLWAFALAVAGTFAKLPDRHSDADTKDAVKLVLGLIATISALVLSLLIASANTYYNTQRNELQSLLANVVLLDRQLTSYGPEAQELRHLLHDAITGMHDRIWRQSKASPSRFRAATGFFEQIQNLSSKTDAQRSLQSMALQTGQTILQTRLLMLEQRDSSISWPFLTVLGFWIGVLFFGFGLFASFNSTVITALLVGSLSASAALFLILELNDPFQGMIQISDAPMREILLQIDR